MWRSRNHWLRLKNPKKLSTKSLMDQSWLQAALEDFPRPVDLRIAPKFDEFPDEKLENHRLKMKTMFLHEQTMFLHEQYVIVQSWTE